MWSSRPGRCTGVHVKEGSRLSIGTDHEVISMRDTVEVATCKGRVKIGGLRELKGQVLVPPVIDQESRERLAKNFAKPVGKPRQGLL